jgi:hypothetical protein
MKSIGKILGALDYEKNGLVFSKATIFLLENIKPSVRPLFSLCNPSAKPFQRSLGSLSKLVDPAMSRFS